METGLQRAIANMTRQHLFLLGLQVQPLDTIFVFIKELIFPPQQRSREENGFWVLEPETVTC